MRGVVEFSHVGRLFGTTRALDDVTFSVREGSVCALLGANGAGKTTALRLLLGLARPTSGSLSVFGEAPGSISVRRRLGYLPDVPSYPAWMNAREYLRSVAELTGVGTALRDARIDVLLDMAGLSDASQPIGGYSRGMRQRLGLAQALIASPVLVVLDEPTSALDPAGRREVLNLMTGIAGHATIVLSSHNLAEVQHVCTDAIVMDSGKVLFAGSIADLRGLTGSRTIRIETTVARAFAARAAAEPWCASVRNESDGVVVIVSDQEAAEARIPAIVAELGGGLRALIPDELSLEDAFLTLTENTEAAL